MKAPLVLLVFLLAVGSAAASDTGSSSTTEGTATSSGTAAATSSTTSTGTTTADPAATPAAPTAKPYEDKEFEPWVLKLRRAEIIAVGAFPVAFLFSGLGYDYAYYTSNGFPQSTIPWPLGPGTSQFTGDALQKKNWSLIGISVGVSLAIAALDWVLGL
jgi:hypothetical protein